MKNLLDKRIEEMLAQAASSVSDRLDADILYYYGEINIEMEAGVRRLLAGRHRKRLLLALTTQGGAYDAAEMIIEDMRHFYDEIFVALPDGAMSAGTVVALSGDALYMNYASNLGPIDTQKMIRDEMRPCDGYARFGRELLARTSLKDMTSCEYERLCNLDLARIADEEMMAKLPVDILTKNMGGNILRTGTPASEVADALADRSRWLVHGRPIRMRTLLDLGVQPRDYTAEPWGGELDDWHEMEKTYLQYKGFKGVLAHGSGGKGIERIAVGDAGCRQETDRSHGEP